MCEMFNNDDIQQQLNLKKAFDEKISSFSKSLS